MATETAFHDASPAKFSRYRSVRRAQTLPQQAPAVPPMPSIPPVEPRTDATVNRSMSRYHRRPTTSHAPAQKGPAFPPLNSAISPPVPATAAAATPNTRTRALSSPQHAPNHTIEPPVRLPNASRSRGGTTTSRNGGIEREPSRAAREEARELIEKEAERQRRLQERLKAEKRAKLEAAQAEQAERDGREKLRIEEEAAAAAALIKAQREAEETENLRRQKEEQDRGRRLQKAESATRLKKKEDEARNAKSPPTSPLRHGGGLRLFGRRQKDDAVASPQNPANSARPRQISDGNNRDLSTIRPGGGGAVLGIDAPKSAINAGDRRVLVVCEKQEILLPVTPTTTPLDLIKSASTCLTVPIDVRTAVILESFQKVGLRRPLRNYEHVRDVMNSWDDDKQNDLVIVDSSAHGIDQRDLLASQVPDSKPSGMGCYIHYSSKPGKWSKRYFSLNSEGQLTMSKSEASKDHENICHLSDFDVYMPTERKLAKVKPPKKICYAVKSQQKSNIYLDETRFVHFFCTNDKSTASLFYRTLQGWRSWYLIHVMGEGQRKKAAQDAKGGSGIATNRFAGTFEHLPESTSHVRNASIGSHYQLGSFMPLLDLDQFSKEPKEDIPTAESLPKTAAAPQTRLDTKSLHARKMSTRAKGPPPLSYNLAGVGQDNPPVTLNKQNSTPASNASDSEKETFASSGLLGRKYSERQRALQEKETEHSGPFTEGPSLLNNLNTWNTQTSGNTSGLARQSSVRSNHGRTSSDIQRSVSTRAKPRPLVDLTPQYKEPPQHAKKGKGFIPEGSSGPLIENATSIEEAIKVPSSTDWRARPATARPNHGTYGTGGFERTRSLRGRGEGLAAYTVNNHLGAPEDDSTAFTGGGLLARAGVSQGHTPVGHGVLDGSRARGPMLDMREAPQFASGSLLASVERQHGVGGPVIDRSNRRQSVDLS